MDRLELIALLKVDGQTETDRAGFPIPPELSRAEVWARILSVGYSEFYRASQIGMTADVKAEVRACDYDGETIVEIAGKRYAVLRTYSSKTGEFVELTLSDLSKRGDTDGAD
jgi:SPP1 family predicted phage head-tail adaptor